MVLVFLSSPLNDSLKISPANESCFLDQVFHQVLQNGKISEFIVLSAFIYILHLLAVILLLQKLIFTSHFVTLKISLCKKAWINISFFPFIY